MSREKTLNLWKYNKRSGLWDRQRDVTPETKDEWLKIHQKDEPDAHFHVSTNKPKHNPTVKEEVNVGAIAGSGDPRLAPDQREPGRSPGYMATMLRRKLPEGTFAGKKTFIVDSNTFHKGRMAKKKGEHWKKYFQEDEAFRDIREFANKNPKKSVILQDETTGALYVARYGKEA